MENTFVMETDASITLNYLIYIQNIYLNQSLINEELKFPYLSTNIVFQEDFELKYKELWEEVTERIFTTQGTDLTLFYENKNLFYQKLLEQTSENLISFDEVYKGFRVWWGSFVGEFSIKISIAEAEQELYSDLSKWLLQTGKVPQKRLHINLIYDDCILANSQVSSYLAVIPIKDFYFRFKELVPRIRECFV